MFSHVVLFAGLIGAPNESDLPPKPDFAALLPTFAKLPASERSEWEPYRAEAAALVRYLDRAWAAAKTPELLSDHALNLLTAVQQLDSALLSMNPKPTV